MPLYDCVLLAKSTVKKEALMSLVSRLGQRVLECNGVITRIKSFGTVQLGYGIRKLDGRHYQGYLMQMTMMVPPSFPKGLQHLNKEDRLLRWLVVKHRNTVYGLEALDSHEGMEELSLFGPGSFFKKRGLNDEGDDVDDDDDDDVEYEQD